MTTDKLYVVVRSDLSPGQQAVQACHAAIEFGIHHPGLNRSWSEKSNYLALLQVPDEKSLHKLIRQASERGVAFSAFKEPDLNHSVTAIAIEPAGKRLCRNLKLALAKTLGAYM